jgi:hypothetical protein
MKINMDPILTAAVTSFVTTVATNSSKAPLQTLDDLWYLAFGKINHLADLKRAKYEVATTQYKNQVAKRIIEIDENNLQEPPMSVVGPALEASRFYIEEQELQEMFANVIAASMDKSKSKNVHPSFVEIIKQLNSDEAKMVKLLATRDVIPIIRVRLYDLESTTQSFIETVTNFSSMPFEVNCSYPDLGPSYLENLERLGLVTLDYDVFNTAPNAYNFIENHPIVTEWKENSSRLNRRFEIQRGALSRTAFGTKFIQSCVIS